MAYNKQKTGVLMVLILCLSAGSARTQSIAQLIEQLTLDTQKLAELKTILKDMQAGYQVLDKGYTNIRDIVKGNFSLHKAFLDGLLTVSTPVRQYYKVTAILDKEKSIVVESQNAKRRWIASGLFTPGELEYMGQLYGALSDKGNRCLDRLTMVVTSDALRMSDAERMKAIDRIYADVTEQLAGLRRFNDATSIQVFQRSREQSNLQTLKNMYGNLP
jgi:hypothetical protein